jgi:hypothetical protein
MHADLIWLAKNEPYWAMDDENYLITINKGSARYVHYFDFKTRGSHRAGDAFTRDQHQAARDELGYTAHDKKDRPSLKTQVTAWHAAEDEILASEMGDPESCPDYPFTNPDEDEAWQAAEERMDIIGHNGGTGDHYEAPASKYHVQIKGQWVDVYDILTAYSVTNPADAHAIKKMLCPGQRGAKDGIQDRREAIVSLQRAIELEGGL